jgi:hypothetical protein
MKKKMVPGARIGSKQEGFEDLWDMDLRYVNSDICNIEEIDINRRNIF